jgi:hypothetical protein
MGVIIQGKTIIQARTIFGSVSAGVPSIVASSLVTDLNPAVYSSGTIWNDSSASGYNATLVGAPAFTSAGAASYFTLNGTSQYAFIPDSTSPNLRDLYLTKFTYQVWAKFSIATGAPPIITKGDSGSGQGQIMTFMDQASPVTLDIMMNLTGTSAEKAVSSTYAGLSFGTWYLCTYVYSGTTIPGSMTDHHLYVNGVEYATTSGTSDTWSTTPSGSRGSDAFFNTCIGYSPNTNWYNIGGRGPNRFAPMILGRVLIYNRNLSGAEVLQNFNATKANYGY